MRFKRQLVIEKGMIDLTPLVNVFFLLLIFFVFTSSFIFQPGIKVNLPKAVTSDVVQEENVVITVTADDRIYLNDRPVARDELTSNLKLIASQKASLLIKADSRSSLGIVVDIWDMCRNEGVPQVSIATSK